jgi:hypothetical protein
MAVDAAERAALRIQCVFRCSRARREIATRRTSRSQEFAAQCAADLETSAAITLQAAQRRHVAEKRRHAAHPLLTATQPSIVASSGGGASLRTTDVSSMMSTSWQRGDLTTAFALSSVASFAVLLRDDPVSAKQVMNWDTSKEPSVLHECAALIIQCKWRVFAATRRVKQMRRDTRAARVASDQLELEQISAGAIQRQYRGFQVRKTSPVSSAQRRAKISAHTAAIRIQALHRQRTARAEAEVKRQARAADFAEEVRQSLEDESARKIQCHIRGRLERKKLTEKLPPDNNNGKDEKMPVDGRTRAGVVGGSGEGLSKVFYAVGGQLLENTNVVERRLFWGIRLLHAVAMDIVLDPSHDAERFPQMEISRWVQGPLGSVIPVTRSLVRSPTVK